MKGQSKDSKKEINKHHKTKRSEKNQEQAPTKTPTMPSIIQSSLTCKAPRINIVTSTHSFYIPCHTPPADYLHSFPLIEHNISLLILQPLTLP